jgi:hypothetical protein
VEEIHVDAALPHVDVAHALLLELDAGRVRSCQIEVGLLMGLADHSPDRPFGETDPVEVCVARDVGVVRADERQAPAARVAPARPPQEEGAYSVDDIRAEAVDKLSASGKKVKRPLRMAWLLITS